MPSIAIHGPATATINFGAHRILLGTQDAPAGDPVIIILNRTSVEDAARLPCILRRHRQQEKPTIVTGDAARLGELLHADDICQTVVNGEEMQISVESYATITPAKDGGSSMGVYRANGFAIFVDRVGWTRKADALRTWLYLWDPESQNASIIHDALFMADAAAIETVIGREEKVTEQLKEIGKRIRDGEKIDPETVPKPIIKRYAWAPYCREQDDSFAHMTLTMRRPPYDAGGALPPRIPFASTRFIEDFVGQEIPL